MKLGLRLKHLLASAMAAGFAVAVAHAQLNANLREQPLFDVPSDVPAESPAAGPTFEYKFGEAGLALTPATAREADPLGLSYSLRAVANGERSENRAYRNAAGWVSAHALGDAQHDTNSSMQFEFDLVSLPIPEPATYGWIGALSLVALAALGRLRNASTALDA
jgi:hypothetical protein